MAKKENSESLESFKNKTSLRPEMRETWAFIKFVVGLLFGFAIFVLGLIAIYIGKFATNLPIDIPTVGNIALIISGACAVVDAVVIWWKVRKVK